MQGRLDGFKLKTGRLRLIQTQRHGSPKERHACCPIPREAQKDSVTFCALRPRAVALGGRRETKSKSLSSVDVASNPCAPIF